jgi:formamidopyrimidine-DNA glycosylase
MMAKVRRRRTCGDSSVDMGQRAQQRPGSWTKPAIIRAGWRSAAGWHTAAMPELPDITVYVERLEAKVHGSALQRVKVLNPFLLRSAVPPIGAAEGRRVVGVERLGKRVVLALEGGLFLVIHLMIAGRLRWLAAGAKPPGKIALALFEFDRGTLALTEAGSKRRAALHLLSDRAALDAMDPGGIDVLTADLAAFAARLVSENHTLKRALTNPKLFSGIGNAYSDEILHRARLSPVSLTRALDAEQSRRLFDATRAVLTEWIARLRAEAGDWPGKVTAFHPAMAVHGRFGLPCPVCGAPVQRIVHADNETNYCARCQTGGKLLADRALSRLLKASWPRHIDDLD